MGTDKDYDSQNYHRRSIRLKEYDYSSTGAYFITICACNVDYLFGNIQDGKIVLNDIGCLVRDEWLKTSEIRPNIKLDEWVVMPNHFHAILMIIKFSEKYNTAATPNKLLQSPSQTLGAIVRGFKSAVTKQINLLFQSSEINIW